MDHNELRTLLEFFPDPTIIVNSKGKIILCCNGIENLLGYTPKELSNQPVEVLVPETFKKSYASHRANFMAAPQTRTMSAALELFALHKNGSAIPVEISLRPIQSEGETMVIASLRNVSEQKTVLKALQLINSLYKNTEEVIDFNSALEIAIHRICKFTTWEYGEAWIYDEERNLLHLSPAWFSEIERIKSFRMLTKNLIFESGTGIPGRIWQSKIPYWYIDIMDMPDDCLLRYKPAKELGFKKVIGLPIPGHNRLLGVLIFFTLQDRPTSEMLKNLIMTVTFQLGSALQHKLDEEEVYKVNANLERQVTERTKNLSLSNAMLSQEIEKRKFLEEQVLQMTEKSRESIGQDLHDGIGQNLTAILYMSESLRQDLKTKGIEKCDQLRDILTQTNESIAQVKNIAHTLYPVNLKELGLPIALSKLAQDANRRYQIDCVFENRVSEQFLISKEEVNIHLYRIAQEAINNAVKHSKANRIVIRLGMHDQELLLTVQDDGQGIPAKPHTPQGMGLSIMQRRAELIQALFDIQSVPAQGTTITCRLKYNGNLN